MNSNDKSKTPDPKTNVIGKERLALRRKEKKMDPQASAEDFLRRMLEGPRLDCVRPSPEILAELSMFSLDNGTECSLPKKPSSLATSAPATNQTSPQNFGDSDYPLSLLQTKKIKKEEIPEAPSSTLPTRNPFRR